MSTSCDCEQKVVDTNDDTALSSDMSKLIVSTDDGNGSTILTLSCCANCGKEGSSDNMNTCNKCKMVKYCNAACKKKHRTKHKKKCERRVAELHDEALFKDPPPPDECPICFRILPHEGQTTFQTCCGKIICNGCMVVMVKETRAKSKPGLCPFCRKPTSTSEKEEMKRLMKLVDSGHPRAIYNYACYARGGDRQDWVKANRLYLKAGELGCAGAYYNLGNSYSYGRGGVDVDRQKAKHYYELAAISGDIDVHNVLGGLEAQTGNYNRAYKHFIIAVKSGNNRCLGHLKVGYKSGIITKDEFEEALRSFQQRQQEIKSVERDQAAAARVSERATFGSAFRRTEDHE